MADALDDQLFILKVAYIVGLYTYILYDQTHVDDPSTILFIFFSLILGQLYIIIRLILQLYNAQGI